MSLQIGFKDFSFKNIELKIDGFNSLGLKIIQLSDLHIDKKMPIEYLSRLVEEINSKKPHIVLFSGDIIQTKAINIKEHLEVFKNIQAPSYYVTGNHDIFYGATKLREMMTQVGVNCLDNEIVKIKIDSKELQLVGFSDRYSFIRGKKREIDALLTKLDALSDTILLMHQPKDIEYIKNYKIDLALAGHTHKGQIFPFSLLVRLAQPYFYGLYKKNSTILYVTSGFGYWGVNVRYRAKSEIPIFTIG